MRRKPEIQQREKECVCGNKQSLSFKALLGWLENKKLLQESTGVLC
jgi:hypothetical protein